MSVDRFMACKGQYLPVCYTSTSTEPRAEFKGRIVLSKRVRMLARAGIAFANLRSVRDGIAAGTRGEVKGLRKGWRWECFPYITANAAGNTYYRLYPESVQSVVYLVNGEEVSREVWIGYLTPSKAASMESGERPECIDIKSENCEFPDAADATVTDYPSVA